MKLTITIGLLLIAHLTFGQDRTQKIDSLLNSLYSKEKINGNFLIAEKGKVIYSHSFGLANETTKEKLNENSIFELASCSKQFTAMGIMILKEKGKLNLDDDITKYLPELSFYKGVTVRNLLNHTGGLPDYMQLMDSLFDKSKIAANKDIIDIFSKHQPKILFEPNTKWEYSNTGYALLASIIEKASGMTYADYLKTAIFQPLKMKNTFVYNRRLSPKKIDNYAFGYVHSDSLKKYVLPDELEETKIVIWLDGIVGDGGVNSTVKDLLIWDRALYVNKLLTKEDMKAVFELATLKDGAKRNYGFGWGIEENADFGKIANHDGGWPGYVTFIDRHITNDKTIIILQNHSNVSIPSKAIRNILYNKPLPVQKIRKEISITTEELQKFVGTYEVEKDFEIKISLDKDQLFSQLTGQNAFRIFVESEMLFFYKVVDAQIQFEKNEKGEISNLFLLQNGKKIEAKRTK
ncbi:serine hydrolase [Flavobacterium sp. LHD-85]|uniref:serine hydrolase n=1 Tax=Flavobacterium sp. LHD-85 TaxID=3071410 RepID=UPI0027DF591E|nr:serine hydrolase [Flavobacterium sp. LHD-85]MDQ6527686.1 serine hydrolase [Flavobacterium sp. LHD-85]